MTILVTGGAGFIGANYILNWMGRESAPVVNLDKLTYAGNLQSLVAIADNSRYRFVQGDIGDGDLVARLLAQHQPTAIVHFAAESHVDRSIHGPGGLHPDQYRRHVPVAGSGARLLAGAARRRKSRLPLSACVHRRGVRLARSGRSGVFRNHGVCAQQPLLGLQGGVRSSGARLPPHLRPADADHQLLQQLRAVSSSPKS